MRPYDLITAEAVDPEDVRKFIVFHEQLNPKFWDSNNMLIREVRLKLMKSAMEFYNFLELPGLKIEDIIVCGSNAAFNYTSLSDLDVHVVVDFTKAPCSELMENFFNTKKTLWNTLHAEVRVNGQPVELYVQDKTSILETNGVYSLIQNKWLVVPKAEKPTWNDNAVVAKTDALADEIVSLLAADPTIADIDEMIVKLKTMRRSGLADGGEFASENLAYKSLRNLGYLESLYKERNKIQDAGLSI